MMHKIISIEFMITDMILLCLKMFMHFQQHLYAVNLILRSEGDWSLNLMSPLVFDKVGHIEINVVKVSDVVLFHIFYVIEIKHEFVGTITVEHDIKSIVNEIDVNHDLKSAVEIIVKLFYVELLINLMKVPVIHVKLLLKLEPDVIRGQPVKEFRQDNELILTSLRKQDGDILITDLIQQCFTHHIYKDNSVWKVQRLQVVNSE